VSSDSIVFDMMIGRQIAMYLRAVGTAPSKYSVDRQLRARIFLEFAAQNGIHVSVRGMSNCTATAQWSWAERKKQNANQSLTSYYALLTNSPNSSHELKEMALIFLQVAQATIVVVSPIPSRVRYLTIMGAAASYQSHLSTMVHKVSSSQAHLRFP
jgi:hypothetical protein